MRQLSLAFKTHTAILTSSVSVAAQRECRYFVNTEGSRVEHGRGFARVVILAHARAADGMNLTTAAFFDALDAASLPADDVLQAAMERVAKDLEEFTGCSPGFISNWRFSRTGRLRSFPH